MPTIVLLPGLACDAAQWRHQGAALQSGSWRVRVSAVHRRHAHLPAMATALLAQVPGPLVLVGSSMGGMLALEAARQAPQRVQAMALLGSTARADTPQLIRLRSEAITLFEQGRMNEVLRANVMFAFHPDGAARPELVAEYLAMVRRAGAAQLIRQNRAVMARHDARALLPALRCPVLVACGEADLLTPPEHSQEMARLIPGARLEIMAACGHMLTMEQPQAVNRLLLAWLQSLGMEAPKKKPRRR